MKQGFKTRDSALAYYINQLDNLDKKLYEPLVNTSWGRDIQLRSGITMSNESTSFIQSQFASGGTFKTQGMPFLSAETKSIPGISVDGKRIVTPLHLLGREISFTSVELERSQLTGQSIDTQKTNALNTLYQMNTDQMVYTGASEIGATGLLNSSLVTASAVATGASASTLWKNKTPAEILADVNTLLTSTWLASAYAVCPGELRLPPAQYGYIATELVSSAGNTSILKYIMENSIANQINGKPLNIQPIKWLTGLGTSGTDRMMCYTNSEDRVRFPMVPIRRETAYYLGIHYNAPYIWAFGEVEFPYPETLQYADGI
jgi:hypothetical protein